MSVRFTGVAVVVLLLFVGRLQAEEDLVAALESVVKITLSGSKGSGFLIARPLDSGKLQTILVTAAHALNPKSDEAKLVVREKQASGRTERREIPFQLRDGEKQLWVKHPTQDVAAVPLEIPAALQSALALECIAGENSPPLKLGEDVWIPGYPVGLEGTGNGFAVLRRGNIASYPLAPASDYKTFIIDASTFGGDSGAPVIIRRPADNGKMRPEIVGILIGKHQQTDRVSLPFEERTVHHPLGLAIIVQAQFIRETIELLPK